MATNLSHQATIRRNIEPLSSAQPIVGTSARDEAAQVDRTRALLIIPEENSATETADFDASAANTRGPFRLDLSDDDSEDNGAKNAETDIIVPDDSDSKNMEYMEPLIQRQVLGTRFLKGTLRLLNVTELSNAPFKSKVSAIAARMFQFYITYQEIEDTTDAIEDAATLEGVVVYRYHSSSNLECRIFNYFR
jgi:hypothetical protein